MPDILTDTQTVTITIIQHADCAIANIVAPAAVEVGENFDISYDCINNGAEDTCYGQILIDGVLVPGTRWDDTIGAGATKPDTRTIPGITGDTTFTIEVGYTKP